MIEDFDVLSKQITRLHDQNESARRIIDNFASRRDGNSSTTTDEAIEIAGLQGNHRVKITEVFKKLEGMGCGRFVPGRKTHPSRFVWETKPSTIAEALEGPKEKPAPPPEPVLTEAEAAAQAASRIITYRFPMRGDFLDVRLPFDLKRTEAERLAQFIESLATQA